VRRCLRQSVDLLSKVQFELGLAAVRSFKRLSYTPWHALAEFIDNSTQSYFGHHDDLDRVYQREGKRLEVAIEYQPGRDRSLRIVDNAMGMSLRELQRALVVGNPPADPTGRSRYGFGLKTAASWFGDLWMVRTKRLDEPVGYQVEVDVEDVASGNNQLVLTELTDVDPEDHFTEVEIRRLHRGLASATRSRIREFLRSMYRQDLQDGILNLVFMNEALNWKESYEIASDSQGRPWRREFDFTIGDKRVYGWAAVLAKGGRKKAGFAIFHSGRVLRGTPAAWRPQEIFGQIEGSNNLVNQRLAGEVHLDDFNVSHTKDDIVWNGEEEEEVGAKLKAELADLITVAQELRHPIEAPTRSDVKMAVTQLESALISQEVTRDWLHRTVPAPAQLKQRRDAVLARSAQRSPDFQARINGLSVTGYLGSDLEPEQEFVTVGRYTDDLLSIVVNMNHPHVRGMRSPTLLDHLQHCTYQALAEWRLARDNEGRAVDVVPFLKDALLRVDSDGPGQSE